MNSTLVYILILVPIFSILAIISSLLKDNRRRKNSNTYTYHKKRYLLTKSEHEFFKKLENILGNRYYLLPQIHLSSLLEHEIKGQSWKGALSHIDRKSVDYVVCDKTYLSPLLVIEFDDSTHSRNDRRERDKEVERIFQDANIPVIRVPYLEIDNTDMITEILNKTLNTEKTEELKI